MDYRSLLNKLVDRVRVVFSGRGSEEAHDWYKSHQLFHPARLDGETRPQYMARQRRQRAVVDVMRRGPRQAPAVNLLDYSRFFLGVHIGNGVRTVKQQRVRDRKAAQRARRDAAQAPNLGPILAAEAKSKRAHRARLRALGML